MAEENKKIDINSFFERNEEVGGIAGKALEQSKLNANTIQANQKLINSLSVTIEAMRTEIRDIANYIVIENKIEKDKREDEKFEAEDANQKKELKDKLLAAGKQGPKGDKGDPSPQGETKSSGGNLLVGIIKTILGVGTTIAAAKFLAPVLLPIIGKTLFPAIAGLASKAIGLTFGFIGANIGKILMGLGAASILGFSLSPLMKPVRDNVVGLFNNAGKFIGDKLKSLFSSSAGEKISGSNMSFSPSGGGGGGSALAGNKIEVKNLKNDQEEKQEKKEVRTQKKGKVTPKPAMEVGKFKPAPPEKPKGFKRFLAGVGDFATGGRFDLDKRGSSVTDKLNPSASILNAVAPPKPDNSAVAPANPPNTSQVIIRPTSPTIPFIRTVKNQYLSTNPNTNKLPPEIARLIQ